MKISVIIPTYKPQNYLLECLDSLVEQTFPNEDFEVIIILNGCTEPWKNMIEKYIAQNMLCMNVKFIHTEYGGVSNARNIGLDNAIGDYITFIDDDDFVSPSYLEQLYKKAARNIVSLCYPLMFRDGTKDFKLYGVTSDYERNFQRNKCYYYNARKFFSGPVYKLIHRDIIGDRRFDINFKNGEDSLFMFYISNRMSFVNFTNRDAIYYRRIRKNSAVTTKRRRDIIIANSLRMIVSYTRIYISSPFSYSFYFYITRILGALKIIFKSQIQ